MSDPRILGSLHQLSVNSEAHTQALADINTQLRRANDLAEESLHLKLKAADEATTANLIAYLQVLKSAGNAGGAGQDFLRSEIRTRLGL